MRKFSFSFFLSAVVIAVLVSALIYIVFHNIFYALGSFVTILLMASHGDPRHGKNK